MQKTRRVGSVNMHIFREAYLGSIPALLPKRLKQLSQRGENFRHVLVHSRFLGYEGERGKD